MPFPYMTIQILFTEYGDLLDNENYFFTQKEKISIMNLRYATEVISMNKFLCHRP